MSHECPRPRWEPALDFCRRKPASTRLTVQPIIARVSGPSSYGKDEIRSLATFQNPAANSAEAVQKRSDVKQISIPSGGGEGLTPQARANILAFAKKNGIEIITWDKAEFPEIAKYEYTGGAFAQQIKAEMQKVMLAKAAK